MSIDNDDDISENVNIKKRCKIYSDYIKNWYEENKQNYLNINNKNLKMPCGHGEVNISKYVTI